MAAIILLTAVAIGIDDYPLDKNNPSIELAASYLLSCQNEDSGFGPSPDSESELISTCQAIIALSSLEKDFNDLEYGNPLNYLSANQELLANLSNAMAQTGRFVVALTAAGSDPHSGIVRDHVALLKSYSHPSGEIGKENYIWDDTWVLLALAACNESGSKEAIGNVEYLKSIQTPSGGWSWNGGFEGQDPDTTSIVVCAILAAGENCTSVTIQKALQYLKVEQNDDGGFSSLGSNAATDGWAILAIWAAGQNPAEWKVESADPVHHLMALQKEDGSIWWKNDSAGMSFEWTANGIVALTGGELPPVICA